LLYECYVLGLAAVGRAGNRKLLVAPPERLESAGGEKRQHLERFGAGAPVGERVTVARRAEELVAVSYYRGVYPVLGFDRFTAGYNNV
jgi:hypothetical protein